MTGKSATRPRYAPRPCPLCSKMSVERYHPFCSGRCADVDLHRWLGGSYVLPGREPADFADGDADGGDDRDD